MKVQPGRSDPRELRNIANSPEVQDVAHEQAKDIQRDARRLAPRRTGNLRRHIEVEKIVTDQALEGWAIGWGDRAFYGPFVEDGGERRAPRPHLVPAAIKNGATHAGAED